MWLDEDKKTAHRPKLFHILGAFLADCVCFTGKRKVKSVRQVLGGAETL